MLEDRNGYLWIGTEGGGLARFDGREFKVYTTLDGLQSNIIGFLKLDDKQNLWITHPRGITKYDGKTFKKFEQPGSPRAAKSLRRMFELNDTIFFTSSPGYLGKIYNDSVYYWSQPVYKDKSGVLVAGVYKAPFDNLILYLTDSSFLVRTQRGDFTISHKLVFNRLYNLFSYKNEVWLTTDMGYFSVDLKTRGFAKRTLPIKEHIIQFDSLHQVFWTRAGNNMLKETIVGNTVKTDTVMRDVEITQVLVDSEGNTWFGSDGAGLFKYFIQDFDRCTSNNMRNVMAIMVDREGASWIGSSTKGLWKIHNGKISSYLDPKDVYRNSIFYIAESPGGEIWAASANGLGQYLRSEDKFKWYTRNEGLSGSGVVNIQFDEKGGVWIGTFGGGVNYYDGEKFTHYTIKDGLSANMVRSMHYSDRYKRLFVGDEFGVTSISGGVVTQVPIRGLENTSVLSMEAFNDSLLLIGTGGAGVVIYNPEAGVKKYITTKEGLPSDFIYFVAPDENQYLWIGSEKGITRIRLDRNFDITENLHYDYDNGLVGVETNQNSFYISGNRKYFGLIDGLYQYNDLESEERRSFDLHLTGVELLYGQYPVREYADSTFGFFKLPYRPSLPPDKNHITFHFNRVDKRYPKSVKFKYFLENFDKTWSQPSSATEVTYSNLPPGDYVFRVMSTNKQGSWADAKISYAFTIRAPFYRTASFVVGTFILFAGLITLILYIRVKQRVNRVMMLERIRVKEQETLRKEIARDFHDEMGNQLTRIINYISLLKLNSQAVPGYTECNNDNDLYSKVEDSAKYLYTGTRDFIWSIDPGNDELSKLFIHIRDFGEKLFEEKNIQFRAFNKVKEKIKLPYGFSREANLIFKEAMTNAFKYSLARNVTLTLMRDEGDGFEMCFEDDGVGFYTGEIEKSNGLQNIRERADRIRADLRIISEKNQGTKIILNFKLTKTLKYGLAF
jgi:ligand-binding sensor domain-containing protein/signal transduction histidine kinase